MDNEQHLELAHWVIGFFDGEPMRKEIFNKFTPSNWAKIQDQLHEYFSNLESTSFVLSEPNGKASVIHLSFKHGVKLSVIGISWSIRVIYVFDGQVIVVK